MIAAGVGCLNNRYEFPNWDRCGVLGAALAGVVSGGTLVSWS